MKSNRPVVLITGCSSGIGRALAIEFAAHDFNVFASARNINSIIDLKNNNTECIKLDVTNQESIKNAIAVIITQMDRIDYLINNAGYLLMGPVVETPLQSIRKQLETNLIGPIALIQEVLPFMLRQKSGRIINVGSISAIMVTPFGGIYSGSKADLHAISEALRLELLPFGIEMITIITGAVKSSISKKAKIELKEDSIYSSISKAINKRKNMSQISSTNTEVFAKKFFRAVTRNSPPSRIKIGKGANLLSFLKLILPNKLLDKIRRKRFRLNEL